MQGSDLDDHRCRLAWRAEGAWAGGCCCTPAMGGPGRAGCFEQADGVTGDRRGRYRWGGRAATWERGCNARPRARQRRHPALARMQRAALDTPARRSQVVASAIVDKYIGESARIIREMFGYAKAATPHWVGSRGLHHESMRQARRNERGPAATRALSKRARKLGFASRYTLGRVILLGPPPTTPAAEVMHRRDAYLPRGRGKRLASP